jgi:hypothetical protein
VTTAFSVTHHFKDFGLLDYSSIGDRILAEQPDYDKTLNVYKYLVANASGDDMVQRPLREIASDMGYRSWTSVRYHTEHLCRAGTIRKHKVPKTRVNFHIVDKSLSDGDIMSKIAEVPRVPWKEHGKKQALNQELNMPVTWSPPDETPKPAVFGGRITIDGLPPTDGTRVQAIINDVIVASGIVADGRYGVTIPQPRERAYSGTTVTFLGGDRVMAETGIWEVGGGRELDLTAAPLQIRPSVAFAELISANNLERIWHFDPSIRDIPPEYGWFLYDPRPAFSLASNIDYIRSGKCYWVYVRRNQLGTVLGGKVIHLYEGWNSITWP